MYKLGIKHDTDKITHHGYHRFYDYFLKPIKNNKMNVLEIGVYKVNSIKLWLDFFKNANIYGIDINKIYFTDDRVQIFKGDQSNMNDLKKIVNKIGKCGFIIDDGSHVPKHQLDTFNYLFDKCLDYGGIYIIEDVETSYWKKSKLYGYDIDAGYMDKNSIVEIFKDILDIVNSEFLTKENKEILQKKSKISYQNLKYISMINFGYNCIIIKKMTLEDYEKYGKRKYRYAFRL